jgi:hypothetical protein
VKGWPLVGWAAALVLTAAAGVIAVHGWNDAGLLVVLRVTARCSLVLFLLAFTARPARQLWQTPITKWLLANRRYLGVSFAVSHGIHLVAILARGMSLGPTSFFAGAPLYGVIAVLTITSFDRTAAWVGRTWWKRIHTVGVYALWGFFAIVYVGKAVKEPLFAPAAAVTVAAGAVRAAAALRRRGATSSRSGP